MKSHAPHRIFLITLCALSLFCEILPQIPAEIAGLKPTSNDSRSSQTKEELIHFGDLIEVDVVGSTEYDWRGTLNPEGFLDGLDFAGDPVYGLCAAESEVARAIAAGYGKLLRAPKVVVTILDRSNRAISLLDGAVKKPQRFRIRRAVFLNELLILAGGLTERASGEIRVFRPQRLNCDAGKQNSSGDVGNAEKSERFVKTSETGNAQTLKIRIADLLKGDERANPQILSGDIVSVLEADPIYIIGGVTAPKQISSRSQITLSRAIDSAGGLTKDALENAIVIFRREGRETKTIRADLSKIKTREAADVVLKAFDIIDVAQKNRETRRYPPVIQYDEPNAKKRLEFPLRIID